MKKILLIFAFLLFIPNIYARDFKSDYIDINDYVIFENENENIESYLIKSKYFDNNILIQFNNNKNKYLSYVVSFYNSNYEEVDRFYNISYVSNHLYIPIKDINNTKYYKLYISYLSEEDYKNYHNNEEALEINNEDLLKLDYTIKYSDSYKEKENFYLENFSIYVDIYKNEENDDVISKINYDFDFIAKENVYEYKFKLFDEFKNMSISISDSDVIYMIDKNYIYFHNLKEGKTNIKIKYDIKDKYSKSYGVYYKLYKNIYPGNIFDYINLKINTNFNIDMEDSFYCHIDKCLILDYTNTLNQIDAKIKGLFNESELDFFIKKKQSFKEKAMDIVPNVTISLFVILTIIYILVYANKIKVTDKYKYPLLFILNLISFIPFIIMKDNIIYLVLCLLIYHSILFIILVLLSNKEIKNKLSKFSLIGVTLVFEFTCIFIAYLLNKKIFAFEIVSPMILVILNNFCIIGICYKNTLDCGSKK